MKNRSKVVWLTPHHVGCDARQGHVEKETCECDPSVTTKVQYDKDDDVRYGCKVITHRPFYPRMTGQPHKPANARPWISL